MAVQIHFLSVVLRRSSFARLDLAKQKDVQVLLQWDPEWFREDEHLLATSFMCPADVRRFGAALDKNSSLIRGRDWVVVDMALGPVEPVHWLSFQGRAGEFAGAWLEGTEPGPLACVAAPITGPMKSLPSGGQVIKLFGRDSNHDAAEHRKDFGSFLPAWGGSDLWLYEVAAGIDALGNPQPAGFISLEAALDFEALLVREGMPRFESEGKS